MKKATPIIIYLIGWIYPITALIINLLNVRTKLMGIFDFHNDSIIGYIFLEILLAVITFAVYFIYFKLNYNVSKGFYFTLLSLLLYYPSLMCNAYYSDSWDHDKPLIVLVVVLIMVAYVIYSSIRHTHEKT